MRYIPLAVATVFAACALIVCAGLIKGAVGAGNGAADSARRYSAFYEADADASRFLLYMDSALSDAETFAIEYLCNEGYAKKNYKEMSVTAQSSVYERYVELTESGKYDAETFAGWVVNRVYFHKAYGLLRERLEPFYHALADERSAFGAGRDWLSPDIAIMTPDPDDVGEIKAEAVFYAGGMANRLTARLSVAPLSYSFDFTEISVSARRDLGLERYIVTSWAYE